MHPWKRPKEPEELRSQRAALTRAFVKEHRATGKTPSCEWPKVKNAEGELVRDRNKAFRLSSRQRMRPLPPGLDERTARLRHEALSPKAAFDDKPFRDFYAQDQAA